MSTTTYAVRAADGTLRAKMTSKTSALALAAAWQMVPVALHFGAWCPMHDPAPQPLVLGAMPAGPVWHATKNGGQYCTHPHATEAKAARCARDKNRHNAARVAKVLFSS